MLSWARFRRFLAIGLFNIAFFACLVELTGLIYYYGKDGVFFYVRGREDSTSAVEDATATTGDENVKNVLHPVLGFIRPPSMPLSRAVSRNRLQRMMGSREIPEWFSWRANNYGYFDRENFPYVSPRRDEYIIGIFGGSVAQWFALQGTERLVARLQQDGFFAGRKVRVLNFSQGAFKQPQQLQSLSYFLSLSQKFDMVINIDGFNEVALSFLNLQRGIDAAMPSAQQILPIISLLDGTSISTEHLDAILEVKRARQRLAWLDGLAEKNPSAGAQVVLDGLRQFTSRRYWETAATLDAMSNDLKGADLIYVNKASDLGGEDTMFREMSEVWMSSSLLMRNLARSLGIRYVHVLQPNQYYSRRNLSAKQRRIAINSDSLYGSAVEKGYPYLVAGLSNLREEGILAVDAVNVFEEAEGLVYSDSCCHYTQLGNEILADYVADQMIHLMEDASSFEP